MTDCIDPIGSSRYDSISLLDERRKYVRENTARVGGTLSRTDNRYEIGMTRECSSDIEKIRTNRRLSEEFWVLSVFKCHDLYIELL